MKKDMAKITIEGQDSINGEVISHFIEEKVFTPQWEDDVKINHRQGQEESNPKQELAQSTERKVVESRSNCF